MGEGKMDGSGRIELASSQINNMNATDPNLRQSAQRLAEAHYRAEPGMSVIHHSTGGDPTGRTIHLLEVNAETCPSGIILIDFPPDPAGGIPFASLIIEVTPDEFEDIRAGKLPLPDGWAIGDPIARPAGP